MTDIKLLNLIRQNVEMGIDGIEIVLPNAQNPEFRAALEKQQNEYRSFYREADELLGEIHGVPKDVPVIAKMSAEMMSSIKTMSGDDTKIAEEMVRGTTTGIAKLIRHLNEYGEGDQKITSLAKRLIKAEEANAEAMKAYL